MCALIQRCESLFPICLGSTNVYWFYNDSFYVYRVLWLALIRTHEGMPRMIRVLGWFFSWEISSNV